MDETDIALLQRREQELAAEVERLRIQIRAGLGSKGQISFKGARTTPIGPDELSSAVEKTRMPMIMTDPNQPDEPIIFANRAFQELSGCKADELLGRNCRFLQGPDTDPAHISKIRDALTARRDISIEIQNYRSDGTPFLNELYISPVFDHDGRLMYNFASQIDVTQSRRDRRLVEEGETRLQTIFDSAADLAIVATDCDGRVTDWNSGAERIFGWTAEAMRGVSAERIFTPEDRAQDRAGGEMRKALANGRAVNERWHVRQDGARFWASGDMTPLLAKDGKHLGFLSVLRDRTEQHLAGERLAQSEERYRSLFEALDAGFCVIEMKFDGDGKALDYRFVEVNPAFERQTGLTGAAGRWMRELAPAHEQYWFDTYGRVALTGEPTRFEDAAEALGRWYDVHAYRVGGSAARRVAVLFSDISRRRQTEHDLHALTLSLESQVQVRTGELMAAEEALRQSQKMEAVGQLTGGLAHDFNNLLTGITGSLELLGMRIGQGRIDELDRYIAAAQGAARRAAALTHRLLAFSRRQTLDPKPTDVNRLTAGMDELIRRTIGPSVQLEMVLASDLWVTLVDPNQLENALLNLCINARDAMPTGGRLTVETSNILLDDHAARERDLAPGQYVSLLVSDTGTGMTPEVVARAFDPFFTTKPIGMGTGLGLSMIYGFAKQSGGQVRIHSTPGLGTKVWLYLPRLRETAVTALEAEAAQEVPRALHGQTVMVVDDEEVVRMLVVEVLRDLGYAALEAADARSGLLHLDAGGRIDLLITDVGLPGGMNGRQLADAARVRRAGLKVLFITGFAESAAVGNGSMEAGMEVMTKPFAVEALATKIQAMIRD